MDIGIGQTQTENIYWLSSSGELHVSAKGCTHKADTCCWPLLARKLWTEWTLRLALCAP